MSRIQGQGLQIGALLVMLAPGVVTSAAEDTADLLELDLATLMTIEISPSADASALGLSQPLPGGQIASGARLGILGGKFQGDIPFSITSYTSEFITDQQAVSVGDVLQYDASVRVARGSRPRVLAQTSPWTSHQSIPPPRPVPHEPTHDIGPSAVAPQPINRHACMQ